MGERQYNDNTTSISLNDSDFSDGLNSFGVEETQNIAKSQLDSFLLSDPSLNSDKIVHKNDKTEEEILKEKEKERQLKEEKEKKLKEGKTKEEELNDSRDSLNSWLNKDDNDSDDDNPDLNKDKSLDNKDKNKDPKKDQDSDQEDNTFDILAKDLLRLGVFTNDEGEEDLTIKSPEEFLERFKQEKEKQATEMIDNFLARYGEEYRNMFESVFIKGVDPKDYIASYNKLENFKDLDITKPDIQEKVFFQFYRDQGLSEERIAKRFDKVKDLGDLTDEVKDMHEILIQKEEKNLLKLESDKQEQLKQKQLREQAYQQNVGKILQNKVKIGDVNGYPITQKEAQETFDYLTQKPYKLPNGELITEMHKDYLELDKPENHETKVLIGLILKNKGDLSKVAKKAVSKTSTALFSDLTNKKRTQRDSEKKDPVSKSFFE